jgi:hypothetical protein
MEQFEQEKSPLVASVQPIDAGGAIHEMIRPVAPSPIVALVKQDDAKQDVVEVWDLSTGTKASQAAFARDPGANATYAINASGTTLARVAHWPKLSVRIWSMADQKETRAIALNEKFGTPDLLGFLTGEKLAVRWTRGFQEGLEIWDAATGLHGKQVNLERYQRSSNNGVVSPDGKYFALIATQTKTGKPQLQVYDLLGPTAGFHWVALPEMDAATAAAPSGLGFSPDGKKLAALFTHNAEGIIFCWRSSDQKKLGDYSLAVPAPAAAAAPARGMAIRNRLNPMASAIHGLDWMNDGNTWLVMNDLLMDANSGRQIGRLNCPPVAEQWALDASTLAVRYDASLRESHIATIKLDRDKLAAPATSPAPLQ